MEQHAVPQDITGFKFKLVGDMTLVQFGELAFGLIMAWVIFSSPLHVILKYPFGIFFALLGVGLAFVPIEERPMHTWIFNFFKSIYRPTYFVWKKSGINPIEPPPVVTATVPTSFSPAVAAVPNRVLNENEEKHDPPTELKTEPVSPSLSVTELLKAREEEQNNSDSSEDPKSSTVIGQQNVNQTSQNASGSQQKSMTIEELVKMREQMSSLRDQKEASELSVAEKKINQLTEQNKDLLMQIDEIRNKLYQMNGQDASRLTADLDVLMEKKNTLSSEIAEVRDRLAERRVAPLKNPAYQELTVNNKTVRAVPKVQEKHATLSLTSIPNVVNGMVLDFRANPIEGAILIIKDESNNSIRALRTNKVGQFIASTPLSDGKYFIEVEKSNFNFDIWQLTLTGELVAPIEIRAKEIEG